MKKRKIVLNIFFLFLGGFLGYRKWHYESANAFYLSHKQGESLYKQQRALVKSVNPEVMKELGIEVFYKARSSDLYTMTKIEDGISYSFTPHIEGGSTTVALFNADSNERVCSFWFEKNLDKTGVIYTEVTNDQTIAYKKDAIRIYKQIFEEIYENWEIQ
ncbi:hypothetical protein [Enterococcus sp. AZ196]|uniref:hypothetical protein n=1 Tax=Enterococcus sp. AZ196 TaxID=2774659 RepID=UPI003D2BEA19